MQGTSWPVPGLSVCLSQYKAVPGDSGLLPVLMGACVAPRSPQLQPPAGRWAPCLLSVGPEGVPRPGCSPWSLPLYCLPQAKRTVSVFKWRQYSADG